MLEVCVDSLESAVNAINGGADELELCSSLAEGGLTPSVGLVGEVLRMVNNVASKETSENRDLKRPKINVMLRCRSGSEFCFNDLEIDTMVADLRFFKKLGVDRFVFGALTSNQEIDSRNCSKIIAEAEGIPVTFHRAFDVCKDPKTSIKYIIELGFNRVLTSGQKPFADHVDGIELIKFLVDSYGKEVQIMPGAGIGVANAKIFTRLGCSIVHSSCKTVRRLAEVDNNLAMGTSDTEKIYVTDEDIVRKLKEVIAL